MMIVCEAAERLEGMTLSFCVDGEGTSALFGMFDARAKSLLCENKEAKTGVTPLQLLIVHVCLGAVFRVVHQMTCPL